MTRIEHHETGVTPGPAETAGLSRNGAVACVVVSAAVLSSSYTLTKTALRDVPPMTIGLIRFSLAALLLTAWVHLVRRYPRPPAADLGRFAVGGLLGITLYFAIENLGVEFATASDAALLVAAYPAITAFLELVLYRQKTRPGALAGIAMAVAGVYFVIGYAPGAGSHRLIGDILLVVSGIVWALYNFVTRTVSARYPTSVVLCYQAITGAAGFAIPALLEHDRWHALAHPLATTGALAGLTVLCSIAGLGLYAKALQRLRAGTAVNLLNLVPLFGLAIAAATLGEAVTAPQLAGGAVVVAGVAVATRQGRRKRITNRKAGDGKLLRTILVRPRSDTSKSMSHHP